MKNNYKIDNLAELEQLAADFLKEISLPATVLLSGDLGAGKTAFVQVCARQLQVKESVTSPTFNLLNSYKALWQHEPVSLLHYDLYRLKKDAPVEDLFYNDLGENTISFIEWPERLSHPIADGSNMYHIRIETSGAEPSSPRQVTITTDA